jgi:hypothetical protein
VDDPGAGGHPSAEALQAVGHPANGADIYPDSQASDVDPPGAARRKPAQSLCNRLRPWPSHSAAAAAEGSFNPKEPGIS